MAINLEDARSALKGALASLASAGLHISSDPAKAHVPCVLIGPVTEVEVETICSYEVTVPVLLIGKAPGNEVNLVVLNAWLGQVVTAIQAVAEVTKASLGTTDVGQGDLPAFLIETVHVLKE